MIADYLKDTNIRIIRNRNLGVTINKEEVDAKTLDKLIRKISLEGEYYDGDNRMDAILCFVFLSNKKFTINDIAEIAGISKNTAIKELALCEKWFNERNISIVRRKHYGMYLEYCEIDWRNAALNFINEHINEFDYQKLYNSFLDNEFIMVNQHVNNFITYFTKNIRTTIIKNFIRKYETDFHIKFADESFVNIYIYICISIKRISEHKYLDELVLDEKLIDDRSIQWMNSNIDYLSEEFNICFSDTEKMAIICQLLSHKNIYIEKFEEYDYVNEKVIVEKFIDSVEEFLCINLKRDKNLFNNLLMHIKPAIHRMLLNKQIQNPLTNEIKAIYPEIYKSCEIASKLFECEYGKMPNEDEIAYLTMHIAASIEKLKNDKSSINYLKVILVCSSGIGTSNMLCSRILNEFPNMLIEGIYSVKEIDMVDKSGIDLIISTIPLSIGIKESVVYVSPLLNSSDINKIKTFIKINTVNGNSNDLLIEDLMSIIVRECLVENYTRLRNELNNYFKKPKNDISDNMPGLCELLTLDNVKLNVQVNSWEEAILESGKLLYENGCVKKEFIKLLLDSKNVLGHAIVIAPGIAMPHAKSRDEVIKTSISILTLEHPVNFDFSEFDPVWMVITLCVKDKNVHLQALSEIVNLINDQELLDMMRKCRSNKDFMEMIKKISE